jgi:hypothetical protein
MGNEVEAHTQRVRNHLQRPDHPDRQLTNAKVGSTVNRTAPMGAIEAIGRTMGGIAHSSNKCPLPAFFITRAGMEFCVRPNRYALALATGSGVGADVGGVPGAV